MFIFIFYFFIFSSFILNFFFFAFYSVISWYFRSFLRDLGTNDIAKCNLQTPNNHISLQKKQGAFFYAQFFQTSSHCINCFVFFWAFRCKFNFYTVGSLAEQFIGGVITDFECTLTEISNSPFRVKFRFYFVSTEYLVLSKSSNGIQNKTFATKKNKSKLFSFCLFAVFLSIPGTHFTLTS